MPRTVGMCDGYRHDQLTSNKMFERDVVLLSASLYHVTSLMVRSEQLLHKAMPTYVQAVQVDGLINCLVKALPTIRPGSKQRSQTGVRSSNPSTMC